MNRRWCGRSRLSSVSTEALKLRHAPCRQINQTIHSQFRHLWSPSHPGANASGVHIALGLPCLCQNLPFPFPACLTHPSSRSGFCPADRNRCGLRKCRSFTSSTPVPLHKQHDKRKESLLARSLPQWFRWPHPCVCDPFLLPPGGAGARRLVNHSIGSHAGKIHTVG